MAVVWFINPYVNQFIRENTSIYENIQESCRQFVEEKEETSGTDAGESQENAIENMNLPGLLTSGLTQNNTAEVYQYLSCQHIFRLYCTVSGTYGGKWNFISDFLYTGDTSDQKYYLDAGPGGPSSCDKGGK